MPNRAPTRPLFEPPSNNNNNTNKNNNNNNRSPMEAQWARHNAAHASHKNAPALGEVRVHRRTGLMYTYEIYKGKVGWWRLDTGLWGALERFPRRRAAPRELRKFNRKALRLGGGVSRPTFVQLVFK